MSGISFVLSVQSLGLLLKRAKSRSKGLNKVMFYSTIALLFLSTMVNLIAHVTDELLNEEQHIVTDIQYLREGFTLSKLGEATYFGLITTHVKVAEQSSRITAVSLADALTVMDELLPAIPPLSTWNSLDISTMGCMGR